MIERASIVVINLVAFMFLSYRVYRAANPISKQFARRTVASYGLLMVLNYDLYRERLHLFVPWWLYVLGNIGMHASVLLGYFLVTGLLTNTIHTWRAMVRQRGTLVISILSALNAWVDYLRRGHFVSIWNVSTLERSWLYTASYTLFLSGLIILGVPIIKAFWKSTQRHTEFALVARSGISMIGYSLAVGMCIVGITNTVVSSLVNNPYRTIIAHWDVDRGSALVTLIIALGSVPSHAFYHRILGPAQRFLDLREQRRHTLLCYLHSCMTRIVPSIQLNNQDLRDLRLLTEISEAREVLWSHIPHTQPPTVRAEAEMLCSLLASNIVLSSAGPYIPHIPQAHGLSHDLAVAKLLQRLENKIALPYQQPQV